MVVVVMEVPPLDEVDDHLLPHHLPVLSGSVVPGVGERGRRAEETGEGRHKRLNIRRKKKSTFY